MPRRPDDATPPLSDDDDAAALSDLAELAAELGKAAQDSEEEGRIADDIFKRINVLTLDAQKRLFTRPAMKKLFDVAGDKDTPAGHDDPPGTIYYRMIGGERTPWSKKPWTWADLKNWPHETHTAERRMTLGWNGLLVTVFPRRPTTLPAVFWNVYYDGLRNEEIAEQHAAWLFKKDGGRPMLDPSVVTSAGVEARERANHDGTHNTFMPGGGLVGIEHIPGSGDMDAAPARRAG